MAFAAVIPQETKVVRNLYAGGALRQIWLATMPEAPASFSKRSR
jgi:hypothetical protein